MESPSDRSRVRRIPDRARYDRDTVYAIVDEARICHVGFVADGQPFVIPTIHARWGDRIILHGAKGSRMLKHAEAGAPLCITVTLLDGLVLARSVFHHSMNYRSAVLFGRGTPITDREEKIEALRVLTEHLLAGRWDDARQPTEKELNATRMVALPIDEATAKVRQGPPGDDEEDYALPVWAGVLPYALSAGAPVADPGRHRDEPVPAYLSQFLKAGRGD